MAPSYGLPKWPVVSPFLLARFFLYEAISSEWSMHYTNACPTNSIFFERFPSNALVYVTFRSHTSSLYPSVRKHLHAQTPRGNVCEVWLWFGCNLVVIRGVKTTARAREIVSRKRRVRVRVEFLLAGSPPPPKKRAVCRGWPPLLSPPSWPREYLASPARTCHSCPYVITQFCPTGKLAPNVFKLASRFVKFPP